jgi:hypothetical protein
VYRENTIRHVTNDVSSGAPQPVTEARFTLLLLTTAHHAGLLSPAGARGAERVQVYDDQRLKGE